MTNSRSMDSYSEDGVSISEHVLELNENEAVIEELIEAGFDAIVVVQRIEGEFDVKYDLPFERFAPVEPECDSQNFYIAGGTSDEAGTLRLSFWTRGHAKIRILIGKILRGLQIAGQQISCKLCKKAISLILSTMLVCLGIPPAPSGGYDANGLIGSIKNFFGQLSGGQFGAALQSVHRLLPTNWTAYLIGAFRLVGWVFDLSDRFYQYFCHIAGLCSPPTSLINSGNP